MILSTGIAEEIYGCGKKFCLFWCKCVNHTHTNTPKHKSTLFTQ